MYQIAPDGLQRLWMPHRLAYIKGEGKPAGAARSSARSAAIPKLSDSDGLIVARGTEVYAVLNLYPYNSGHLMVVPYRHVADYTDLTGPETAELADFTKRAMTALREASQAQGFNIGMNMGAWPARVSRRICTSTSFPAGAAMPTSCRSSAGRRSCRSSSPTPVSSSRTPGRKARPSPGKAPRPARHS